MYLTHYQEVKREVCRRSAVPDDNASSPNGSRSAQSSLPWLGMRQARALSGGNLPVLRDDATGAIVSGGQDHDEVEVLLESFFKSVSNVIHELALNQKELDAAEANMELKLDLTRNRLLRMDMNFQILAFSAAVGSLVAGLLGMNLPNGREEDEGTEAFMWVTVCTTSAVALLSFILTMCAAQDTARLT